MSVQLTILVDDDAPRRDLQTEHGLSILIDGPGRRLLFDAGASPQVLAGNAEALDVDLAAIDGSIVSHGHYDHTGGLAAVGRMRPDLKVYAHPSAFLRRWADRPGKPLKDVSCPHRPGELRRLSVVLHPILAPEMLADWLVLSGPIGGPRCGGEAFIVRKADEMLVDAFEDELFCLLRSRRGWTVITGCCHRGLRNTLRAAAFLTRGEPIASLVGGLHLRNADHPELQAAVEALRSFGPPEVYPCHCTGAEAAAYLAEQLPGRVHPACAGQRIAL